ncbi:MAG: element excision factor XisH family protein, partial [Fimbriiglobus sp.]
GQYQMYEAVLADQEPDRRLFLAVEGEVYEGILSEPLGQLVLARFPVRILVFDPDKREVLRWIS